VDLKGVNLLYLAVFSHVLVIKWILVTIIDKHSQLKQITHRRFYGFIEYAVKYIYIYKKKM